MEHPVIQTRNAAPRCRRPARSGGFRFRMLGVALCASASFGLLAAHATDVQPGLDVWQTPAGASSHDFSGDPIPAGFFGPGSEPFTGIVQLMGDPLGLSSSAGLEPYDTVIMRPSPAMLPTCPSMDTVPIEIVALNLVSISPITVTYNNGNLPTQWDVRVCLSSVLPQPTGSMTIRHECPDGGTFDSTLPVLPKITFSPAGGGTGPVFDYGDPNADGDSSDQLAPIELRNPCPMGWVHRPDAFWAGLIIDPPVGVSYDGNCDGPFEPLPPFPPKNFYAGLTPVPCTCTTTTSSQTKKLNPEQARLAAHGVKIAEQDEGQDQDNDGHGDIYDNCIGVPNPSQSDCDCDGTGDPCDPDNSSCFTCCLPDGRCIQNASAVECADGVLGGPGTVCRGDADGDGIDDACFAPPCSECGPGQHFIHIPADCPAGGFGQDTLPSGAVLGIDTNDDCVADVNAVMGGPVTIRKLGPLDDSQQYPGLRNVDGHRDVIDTEIIAMHLTGGGVTLTAGGGLGAQALDPTRGAVAEQPGDPALADSFFDVFVELENAGNFYYNATPIHVADVIDCLPPNKNYIHITGCTPLYDTPNPAVGTQPVANLVAANHFTYPGCCLPTPPGFCVNMPVSKCLLQGGTVVPSCLGDVSPANGFDDACEPKCERSSASPTGCTDFCPGPTAQQCLPSSYGCDPVNPGTCGVLDCDCDCHLSFDAANQPFCTGVCPDGVTSCYVIGSGAVGDPYRCSCDPPVSICPQPTAFPGWCDALQATDCVDGAPGEQCWPTETTLNATGGPEVQKCDCLGDECGPVAFIEHADGTYSYRCLYECPDPTKPCLIHRDGVAWTSSWIHISLVNPGEKITCECKEPPPTVCPLESFTNICEPLQATDCIADVTGELCKPEVVVVGPNFVLRAERCDCLADGCGPIIVADTPNGTYVSCDALCPDPTQDCVIFRNGVSTGQISAPVTQFAVGDKLICDCDPPDDQLCPIPAGQNWCNNLQPIDCKDDGTGGNCEPTMVYGGTAAGGFSVRHCDCVGDDCRKLSIEPDAAGATIRCIHECPDPATERCVIHLDGAATTMTSIHTSQAPGQNITCDCEPVVVETGACCYRNSATLAYDCIDGVTQADCDNLMGSFQAGASCTGNILPCCLPNGLCEPMDVLCCMQQQGDPITTGVPCGGASEACCDPNTGACTDEDPACCQNHGGIPQGAGTNCGMPGICGGGDLCDLHAGENICVPRQATDCQDGQAGEECRAKVVTIVDTLGTVRADECDCMGQGCGPVTVTQGPPPAQGAVLSCVEQCPDPNQDCVLWRNGLSTSMASAPASTFNPGDKLICDCDPPDACDLPPNQPWCDARRIFDCKDGLDSELCGPRVVSTTTSGGVDVRQCDCFGDECGPVAIVPVATGFIFRCVNACPDVTQKCYIHRDGVSASVGSVHSSTVAPGEQITCDCVGTQTLCPMDPEIDLCLDLQQDDCITTTADENCRAREVVFDTAGNPHATVCDCFAQDAECGPIRVRPATPPPGWTVSCEQLCPDPTQQCVIWRGTISTGLTSAPSSMFGPNDKLSCGCDPVPQECRPTQDGQACTPCPNPALQCVPTVVAWNPNSDPEYRILDCECTDRCHIQPPPPGGKPFCEGGCPGGQLTIQKKCVKKKDPITGGWICRCVPVHPDLEPTSTTTLKNRYLSMMTGGSALSRGGDEGTNKAIRILLDEMHDPQPDNLQNHPAPDFSSFNGLHVWAGPVSDYVELTNPLVMFSGAATQCDPNFEDYSGEFSIYGAEVAPSSKYSLQIVDEECADSLDEEDCYSGPLMMDTARWGDMAEEQQDPDGSLNQPNVLDISAVVDRLKDLPTALGKTQVQLHYNVVEPDQNVNVLDLSFTVDGVKGFAYPFVGPCVCPSAATCPATDACGRCTP